MENDTGMKPLRFVARVIWLVATKGWMLAPLFWPLLFWHAYAKRDEIKGFIDGLRVLKAQPVTFPRDDRDGVLPPPNSKRCN